MGKFTTALDVLDTVVKQEKDDRSAMKAETRAATIIRGVQLSSTVTYYHSLHSYKSFFPSNL